MTRIIFIKFYDKLVWLCIYIVTSNSGFLYAQMAFIDQM